MIHIRDLDKRSKRIGVVSWQSSTLAEDAQMGAVELMDGFIADYYLQ